MSQKYEKLKTLLKELVPARPARPGLRPLPRAARQERRGVAVPGQGSAAAGEGRRLRSIPRPPTRRSWREELDKVIAQAHRGGGESNPDDSPKVKELRAQLKSDAVDIGALESEVYDHLYSFFRRYYSEGDFLAKRVYKPGVYAIPYEGEEVTLHWANRGPILHQDQRVPARLRFPPEAGRRQEADARALPPGGRRRGRARQRQGGRGQGPRVHTVGARRIRPRLHRRGGRRAGQGTRHPLRVPPGDAYRLARGRTRRKEEAPGPEGPERARRQARPGRGRRRS